MAADIIARGMAASKIAEPEVEGTNGQVLTTDGNGGRSWADIRDVSFDAIVAWNGQSTPVVANIPAGVVVTYGGDEYTGTLAAGAATKGKFYLVAKSGGSGLDNYDGYTVVQDGQSYQWELFDPRIDLSDYVPVFQKAFTTAEKGQARQNIDSQQTISDLETIRTGAEAGSTAYQKPSGGIPDTDLSSAINTSLEKADSAYQKPASGIPSSDMSSAVQTSLGKADSALQEHQSLSAYRTASAQDAIDSGKADKVTSPTAGNFAGLDANGNLTDSGKKAADFLQEHQSLAAYRTSSAQDAIDATKQDTLISSGATVGQFARITSVDANGKPTSWAPASLLYTLTITCATQDQVVVTGQTVTVRQGGSTGQVFATVSYNGQPVSISVPNGLSYYVSVTDTLTGHFNPTTASGIIAGANASVTLTYGDVAHLTTFNDVISAVESIVAAGGDLDSLIDAGVTINDTWVSDAGVTYQDPMILVSVEDVVDADGVTHANTPIMQRKYATLNAIVYDAPESEEATEVNALQGVYYMGLSGTTYTKLTLAVGDPIPYSSYDKVYHNEINFNADMIKYGYNRWSHSFYRRYLNSSGAAGTYFEAQHVGDVAPQQHLSLRGYMAGCSQELLAVAKPIRVSSNLNTVTDGGVIENTIDTFWLPSGTQYYGNVNVGEGTRFEYWKNATGLASPSNDSNVGRIHYALENHSSAQHVRCRSANGGYSCYVWFVHPAGNLSNGNASYSFRSAPACAIYREAE